MRPFLMADPVAGIYYELAAPDLRFAALLVVLLVVMVTGGWAKRMAFRQQGIVIGVVVLLYVWTFSIGNGRYFMAGLLLVGPALVLACRALPGSQSARNKVVVATLGLQVFVVSQSFVQNDWGIVAWREGPAVWIEPSTLRNQPAVFLTFSVQTYSALVTRFHPESRWASIGGQRNVTPQMVEHVRLEHLLASNLPIYLVDAGQWEQDGVALEPAGVRRSTFDTALATHGLTLKGRHTCTGLSSSLVSGEPGKPERNGSSKGFWLCPVERSESALAVQKAAEAALGRFDDVFDRIEKSCPRFFPPNGGTGGVRGSTVSRNYAGSDVWLSVWKNGDVYYRYFRAPDTTRIGTVEQVRRGEFTIACEKLSGRYRLPWHRD